MLTALFKHTENGNRALKLVFFAWTLDRPLTGCTLLRIDIADPPPCGFKCKSTPVVELRMFTLPRWSLAAPKHCYNSRLIKAKGSNPCPPDY
jgi:hypothetical protein